MAKEEPSHVRILREREIEIAYVIKTLQEIDAELADGKPNDYLTTKMKEQEALLALYSKEYFSERQAFYKSKREARASR